MLNMSSRLHVACLLAIALLGVACSRTDNQANAASGSIDSGKHGKKKTRERVGEMSGRADMDVAATGCDSTLWQHVYTPNRLSLISSCTSATGKISDPTPDDDGDMHANLMLDPGQESMVNKRNQKKKGGGLVIEIVCSVQPKSPKPAIKSCQGYHASLSMPAAGAHVRVTGSHVIDTHNGWTEIHPVSRIDVLK